ncbi:MAG: MFS transporter [Clostridiales bacterium]|nr:MFS transporter [Clostridiales bacterium]
MENNIQKLEKNVSIYKNYKMVGYDWLFYYAISVLFFIQVKGFSMSQVMYLSSIFTLANFIGQIPVNMLIEKIGLRKSIIIGNLLNTIAAAGFILFNSFWSIGVFQAICSIGFALKSVAESSLIYSSMKKLGKRSLFSKVEGASNSKYYYLDAIASILAGYMFLLNGYLPMLWCFAGCLIALLISFEFNDVKNDEKEEFKLKEFFSGFRTILKSGRFCSLLIFSFVFTGIINMSTNLYKAILIDFNFDSSKLALVVCVMTALAGLGAKSVYYIEKKTKNKTLTIFSIIYVLLLIVIGMQGIDKFTSSYSTIIICTSLVFMGIIQGAYRVINKKYIVSFTHTNFRSKVVTLYYIFENLGATIICFISGLLLEEYTNSVSTVIMGFISLVLVILVLAFMNKRVGLKPEDYSKKDLYGSELEYDKK